MRLTTVAATLLVAGSTAALAQVARTPVEPKSEPFANMVPGNGSASNGAIANNAMTGDQPPSPGGKTEGPAPRR